MKSNDGWGVYFSQKLYFIDNLSGGGSIKFIFKFIFLLNQDIVLRHMV